jgi:hypothetical protein
MVICSIFNPVFAEEYKKYQKEDFEKIKIMKIEYLNRKLICVNNSQNFRQLKKCWKKKKQKIN